MNSQNDKVDRYLGRVYESLPEAGVQFAQIPWALISLATFGLGMWTLYGGGPERGLTSAHALLWVFIVLDGIMLSILALASFGHAFISAKDPVAGDKVLFTSEYRSNWLSKFTSYTDAPLMLVLAVLASWPVAIFALSLLLGAEWMGKYIHKNNKQERRNELAKMDEAELHALFATDEEEEAVGRDIDDLLKEFENFQGDL